MIVATASLTDRPFNVICSAMRRPGATPGGKPTGATTLRPHFARYGSTPPDSLSEIYQTFIGHAPMLEPLLDLSPAVVSSFWSSWKVRRSSVCGGRIVTLATATAR